MKKNLLAVLLAACGVLCVQEPALSADKAQLPSKVAFSPKKPLKLSIRIETSNEPAVLTCNKLIKFFKYDYTPAPEAIKKDPPWVIEVSKDYEPPFTDADKMISSLRESVCGSTSSDFSWTVTQETTIREGGKSGSAKPEKAKK